MLPNVFPSLPPFFIRTLHFFLLIIWLHDYLIIRSELFLSAFPPLLKILVFHLPLSFLFLIYPCFLPYFFSFTYFFHSTHTLPGPLRQLPLGPQSSYFCFGCFTLPRRSLSKQVVLKVEHEGIQNFSWKKENWEIEKLINRLSWRSRSFRAQITVHRLWTWRIRI